MTNTPDVDTWARDLTSKFADVVNSKRADSLAARTNKLSLESRPTTPSTASSSLATESSHSRSEKTLRKSKSKYALSGSSKQPEIGPDGLPGYSRSAPKIPAPPTDPDSKQFRAFLHQLSNQPLQWENPGLLDEALVALPLDAIYGQADENSQVALAEARSMGKEKAKWGYQDYLIMALLKWFKNDFFKFVTVPQCTVCESATKGIGHTSPTPEESARGAGRVEVYQCTNCSQKERFPRYSDVWTLMQERRGRLGEWANCFSMLCRAVGSKVRWVWSSEDHVWTEVYSEHAGRWVHVDACEEAWDQPRLYTEGWGSRRKKFAYCIAFSTEGAFDVTRRYVRHPRKCAMPRTKCPEEVLLFILQEIKEKRRSKINPEEWKRLDKLEREEERELKHYEMQALLADDALRTRSHGEGEKRPRQSEPTDIKRRRGEADGVPNRESPLESPDQRMEQDGH